MEIIVERKWPKEGYTIGRLYVDGKDKEAGKVYFLAEDSQPYIPPHRALGPIASDLSP